MTLETIFLFISTLSSGMMAGIFFSWTNAVTPGLGKLSNIEYLRSLQSINRVILNPTFYALFFAAVLFIALSAVMQLRSNPTHIFWLLLTAATIYWLGAFAVTFLGNVPLNNILDQADLDNLSAEELIQLRTNIETSWNNYNLVRTITTTISFVLLIFVCSIK